MDYFLHLFDKVLYIFRTSPLSIIKISPDDGQRTCLKHVEYFNK
jgi:hypothetical protein